MCMPSFRTALLAVLASASLLAGCGDPEPVQTESLPTAEKPASGPKPAELPREMVAAVSSGKAASAVRTAATRSCNEGWGDEIAVRS